MDVEAFNSFQKECYDNAKVHGFHTSDASVDDPELLSLQFSRRLLHINREVSEAHDLHHQGYAPDAEWSVGEKLEGIPIELADIVIRVVDMAETYGIDLGSAIARKMKYNESRPYLHNKAY